jgi:FkbM family methyltransferase
MQVLEVEMMQLNTIVKSFFRTFGYDLHRVQKGWGDIFAIQKSLLFNQDVNVIFDLGANVGKTVGQYKDNFPKATIYSFEPFEEPFKQMVHTYEKFTNIKPYNLAVTNTVGTQKFFLNKTNETNSLLPTAAEWGKYFDSDLTTNLGATEVGTVTLDNFCEKENINKIQILKMDIQGAELMALEGAMNLLAKQAIDLIYTEVMFANFYDGQGTFYDLYQFLDKHNFVLYGLYDLRHGKNGTLGQGDAVFIHRALEEKLAIRW